MEYFPEVSDFSVRFLNGKSIRKRPIGQFYLVEAMTKRMIDTIHNIVFYFVSQVMHTIVLKRVPPFNAVPQFNVVFHHYYDAQNRLRRISPQQEHCDYQALLLVLMGGNIVKMIVE